MNKKIIIPAKLLLYKKNKIYKNALLQEVNAQSMA